MSIGYNKTKYPNMTQTSYYRPREQEQNIVSRPVSEKIITRNIEPQQPEPIQVKHEPDMNHSLIKQQPAGTILYKEKRQKIEKPKKLKKNRIAYYSSEDEETAQTKKIYSNDSRFRNYYCLNVCKGKCANCCPCFNCCEWFYGCPLWFYIILIFLFLAVFITFFVLLAFVLNAHSSAVPITVTRIYNRTWYLIQISCGGGNGNCNGNGQGGTSYQTQLVTQGYMSGQQNLKSQSIHFLFLTIILSILL